MLGGPVFDVTDLSVVATRAPAAHFGGRLARAFMMGDVARLSGARVQVVGAEEVGIDARGEATFGASQVAILETFLPTRSEAHGIGALAAQSGSVTDIFLPRWAADRIFSVCTPLYVIGAILVIARRPWRQW